MIGLLVRSVGIGTMALGFSALLYDIINAISNRSFDPKSLGLQLFELIPDQLNLAQAVIQRYVGAWLWDPIIQWLLFQPTFACLILMGLVVFLAGRIFRGKTGPMKT